MTLSVESRADDKLESAVKVDYNAHLGALFKHFHANPELSFVEVKTAARLAKELRDAGFDVTEGVGRTGVVAIMKNGDGPLVMMRADMDGLPVKELAELPYASTVTQVNDDGQEFPVMHACGHDVHITSLVGTARRMAAELDSWSGTLMLIGQPAEEWKISGAQAMHQDRLWERFGLCLLFIHPPAHGSEVSPAARNTLDSARIPRASKLLICGLFLKGRVLAQDAQATLDEVLRLVVFSFMAVFPSVGSFRPCSTTRKVTPPLLYFYTF